MQADTLDTFWHAYVQFVVHVPDVSTIRDTNDHLRTNAGAHLVPHWAARYYDRVPGAPRGHGDSSPSPERTARGSRERDRPSSRSNRKRTSPSPEERYVSLRLEGLLGLFPAEVAAAVSAALAHPTTVPDWAPHQGSCSVVVPHEALTLTRPRRPPGRTCSFTVRHTTTHHSRRTEAAVIEVAGAAAPTKTTTTSPRR